MAQNWREPGFPPGPNSLRNYSEHIETIKFAGNLRKDTALYFWVRQEGPVESVANPPVVENLPTDIVSLTEAQSLRHHTLKLPVVEPVQRIAVVKVSLHQIFTGNLTMFLNIINWDFRDKSPKQGGFE